MGVVIGVDYGPCWLAGFDRHVEGVDDEVRILDGVDGPADDLAAEGVQDGAAVDLAFSGLEIILGKVRSFTSTHREPSTSFNHYSGMKATHR